MFEGTFLMRAQVVRMGNLHAIKIPRKIFSQSRLGREVEVEVEKDKITIRPASTVRRGWTEHFKLMAKSGDDAMVLPNSVPQTRWEQSEWEW